MRRLCAGVTIFFAVLLSPQASRVAGLGSEIPSDPDEELRAAIREHDATQVGRLLKLGGHSRVDYFMEPAINRCDPSIVRLLLGHGASPNFGIDGPVETPLITAARVGCWEITEMLLASGGNPNGRAGPPNRALSPLYWAASYGHLRVAHYLLDAGANPNGRVDKGGPTPLMEAARRGDLMMVEALVRSGAGVNLTDEKNRRAIDYLKEHQRDVDRIATMLRQASKR